MPKGLKIIIKLVLSASIVVYLFFKAGFSQFGDALREVEISFIVIAVILYVFAQILSSYKWALLAKPLGFRKGLFRMVSYYFIGMFFNLFMLGSIGGDMIKAYYLASKKTSRMIRAGYSIFTDRYTGGLALTTILTVTLLIPFQGSGIPFHIRWPIVLGTVMIWLGTIFLPKLLRRFPIIKKWGEKIHLQQMKIYWKNPQLLKKPLFISFIFHILFTSIIILVGRGFGINIPVYYFFIFVPLGDLLSILPISLNGMGVREGCYVFFLHLAGVQASTALAFCFLCLVVVWAVSLLGGIFYLSRNIRFNVKAAVSTEQLKDLERESSFR